MLYAICYACVCVCVHNRYTEIESGGVNLTTDRLWQIILNGHRSDYIVEVDSVSWSDPFEFSSVELMYETISVSWSCSAVL